MIKKTRKSSSKAPAKNLPPRYLAERKRLRQEIKELKADRDKFKWSLYALMRDDITVTKKEGLALIGKQPPLEDLIDELEADGTTHEFGQRSRVQSRSAKGNKKEFLRLYGESCGRY